MENNSNISFTLTEEQIRFIDDEFINKKKELKNVIEELVKQPNNDFQEKDIEQIIGLYIEIKRLERSKRQYDDIRNLWIQAELKMLINKIREKGENININASAQELAKEEQLKFHTVGAIAQKFYKLKRQLQYTQEKNKITENSGAENINISSQNNNETNKDLSKTFGEKLNKCLNDTEQFNNTKNRLTKINTSENNKSNFICFDRKNDKKEDLKQLLNNLCDAESEISEIVYINLSFKPSNTSDKDPIFQHPYLSLPDISDLSSSEHSM